MLAILGIFIECCLFMQSTSLLLKQQVQISDFSNFTRQNLNQDINVDQFLGKVFDGKYNSKQYSSLFNYLDVSQGNLQFNFLNDVTYSTKYRLNSLTIQLYNPIYHDKKSIILMIKLSDFDQNNRKWVSQLSEIIVYKQDKQSQISSMKCNCSYQIILQTQQEGNYNYKTSKFIMNIFGDHNLDPSCNFKFQSNVDFNDQKSTIILYCTFLTIIITSEIFAAKKVTNLLQNSEIQAKKISLITVSMSIILDFLILFIHTYFFIQLDNYFVYFLLPILLMLLLCVFFNMRLLLIIWQKQYRNQIHNSNEFKWKLITFYFKFYFGLMIYLLIMYFFPYELWSILILSFMLMPQIIYNIIKGVTPKFNVYYIFGIFAIKIILPLYYRGCPQNIYVLQPSELFCILWISFFAIEIILLFFQAKLNPRFFIPKCLIPGYHNYQFKYQISINQEVQQCSICLLHLNYYPDQSNYSIDTLLMKQQILVLKTPCNHMFHPFCLKTWIEIKLQCPTCRQILPPLNS